MADLTNTSVNQTLGKVLTTVADLSGTLSTVQSVNGQASALQISSSTVNINGTFKVGAFTVTVPATVTFGGTFSTGSTFSTTGTFSTGGNFSTAAAVTFSGAFATTFTVTGATSLTLPALTDNLVSRTSTDTLTNKTYDTAGTGNVFKINGTTISAVTGTGSAVLATSPTITTPIIAQINDTNGNASIKYTATASAVNQFTSANAATGGAPTLSVTGTDTNINMFFQAKGNGTYRFLGTSTNPCSIQLNTTNNSNLYTLAVPSSLTANRGATLPDCDIGCFVVQRVSTQTGTSATGTTTIPFDNTIPQNTEGDQYMSLSITPKNTANILVIEVHACFANSATQEMTMTLCQDATANALAATATYLPTGNQNVNMSLRHIMTAGTTSSTTFKVRAGGNNAGTTTFLGNGGAGIFGGVCVGSILIREYSS